MQHTTTHSEAPCRQCRRPLLHAWDEGVLVRADAAELDPVVAEVLRDVGRAVYATTAGRWLVRHTALTGPRYVLTLHAEHVCPAGRG